MKIGVPTESAAGERRVALVPDVVKRLAAKDHEVVVQRGAGAGASIPDELFEAAGATIADDVWSSEVIVKVAPPSGDEARRIGSSSILVGFLNPLGSPATTQAPARAGAAPVPLGGLP